MSLSDTPASFGSEANPPLFIYDTSGPYTDPQAQIDIRDGLAPLRTRWIEERGDSEVQPHLSSAYGRGRLSDPRLAVLCFNLQRAPRRARAGLNVSQMHYARRGIVTPEMEYIAVRENGLREQLAQTRARTSEGKFNAELLLRQRPGEPFVAHLPRFITPSSYVTKWPAGGPSSRPISPTRSPSRW